MMPDGVPVKLLLIHCRTAIGVIKTGRAIYESIFTPIPSNHRDSKFPE